MNGKYLEPGQARRAAPFQAIYLFAVVLLGLIVMMSITGAMLYVSGVDMSVLEGATEGFMENINLVKTLQLISSLCLFALPAMLFVASKDNNLSLRLGSGVRGSAILWTALIMLCTYPLVAFLVKINMSIEFPEALLWLEESFKAQEEGAAEMLKGFLKMDGIGTLLINLFVIAVIPAITEELLFRGVVQQLFWRWFGNPHFAIIITGLLFSAIHMQFYGLLPRWMLGVVLGYLFYWSGNLWYPIIGHFLNNGVQVLLVYLGQISPDELETSTAEADALPWYAVVISLVIFGGFMYFYKNSVANKQNEIA